MADDSIFRLKTLPFGARVGMTFLILTLLGGLFASGQHMRHHHENRDGQPGVSMEDLVGAYHGVDITAPMITALESDHPNELDESTDNPLSDASRMVLLDWLNSNRISEDYDNLDLGDMAPAEIIAMNCLDCHSRNADMGDGIGETMPLEYWDDVEKVSFSRQISPASIDIMIASTHTHALGMVMLALITVLLIGASSIRRPIVGVLVLVMGVGLFLDLSAWWLARVNPLFVWFIIVGGLMFFISLGLMLLGVLVDLWLPARRGWRRD